MKITPSGSRLHARGEVVDCNISSENECEEGEGHLEPITEAMVRIS